MATCAGLSPDEIASGLARDVPAPHRSQLLHAGGWTILDDSYNASPDAVLAALDLLAGLPGRRIAVLGEMLELGEPAPTSISAWAATQRASPSGSSSWARARRRSRREPWTPASTPTASIVAADRDEALTILLATLREGDTILVKASRGAALDLLVAELARVAATGAAPA